MSIFRSVVRDGRFTVINVVSLALGLAAFFILSLYYRYQSQYDLFPGSEKVWMLEAQQSTGQGSADQARTIGRELELLRTDYPSIDGARYDAIGGAVRIHGQATDDNVVLIDPGFFQMFGWHTLAGDPAAALAAPSNIVLSASAAKDFFGEDRALGQTLLVTVHGKERPYKVAAIVSDAGRQQRFSGRVFLPLTRETAGVEDFDRWDKPILWTALRFDSEVDALAFERQLPRFLSRWVYPTKLFRKDSYHQFLRPLAYVDYPRADRLNISAIFAVGWLTLGVAIFNYVNLSTARSTRRAREVAVRKIMGATQRQLVLRFLGEAILIAGVSTLFALALTELALPWINALGWTNIRVPYGPRFLLMVVALGLSVGLLGGFYPALILSRFKPAQILATASPPSGGHKGRQLRRTLVTGQFAAATAFAVMTTVMATQLAHLSRVDLGFTRERLIMIGSVQFGAMDRAESNRMLAAFHALPFVEQATVNNIAPIWGMTNAATAFARIDAPQKQADITVMPIGSGYFQTYQSRLIAGRLFDTHHGFDNAAIHQNSSTNINIVINHTAMKVLGFASPSDAVDKELASQSLRGANVVGVISDMRFGRPREAIKPTIYVQQASSTADMFVLRIKDNGIERAVPAIEATWRRVAPNVSYQTMTVNQELHEALVDEQQRASLFSLGAVLAVIIGCVGLYGLAAAETTRRIREIGIRKTLGATKVQIFRLLLLGFVQPVLVANLIGWPIAFVAARRWLAGFDDHIGLSPSMFVGPSLASIVIAMATVVGQVWRVAQSEPARALRYE